MNDPQTHVTITATVRHADWPGGQALCSVLSAPPWFPDMWFLSNGETGRTAELRLYRYEPLRAR